MTNTRSKASILAAALIAATLLVWSLGPLPQDPAYHRFADTRSWLGVPNFWNLASNLGLVLVGVWGLARRPPLIDTVFLLGVLLSGLGSAYYHWAPDNDGLVWDRLGMSVAFAGFFSIVVQLCVGGRLARRMVLPLALVAMGSVVYWYLGEQSGAGDLRPYVLLQFGPALLIPLMLLLYACPSRARAWILASLGCYTMAKLCESADASLFAHLGWISGHSLKHLWAALAALCVVNAVRFPKPTLSDRA